MRFRRTYGVAKPDQENAGRRGALGNFVKTLDRYSIGSWDKTSGPIDDGIISSYQNREGVGTWKAWCQKEATSEAEARGPLDARGRDRPEENTVTRVFAPKKTQSHGSSPLFESIHHYSQAASGQTENPI